ncbi:MAG: DUF4080 domain-containing protein [Firmicutes bacterium]|nr:DUF4080 domain-containing protein [Bacillota bacterium]MDY5856796.1 DUF4080 domain-containing protein [Anaerovoracaceae bacterium]
MKILLTSLNSKYVHSNLALKYLYTVTAGKYSDVEVREFTINQDLTDIYTELVRANYDMVCFSCYIWNIEKIKELASDLKKARPEMRICLGGPEISADSVDFAVKHPWADYILRGEGEYPFYRLCQVLHQEGERDEELLKTVPGLLYRGKDGKIYVNSPMEPMDFNEIPFPYSILDCRPDQVVYYESVRGCPFRCSYCLSSVDKTLRPLAMDRVKADLRYFLFKKVMQVKFIDRTFNYDRDRAREIFRYLMENDNGVTNFHFELCGDLLDRETLDLLRSARKGLFQFEIGIQSANPQTLAAVNRKENIYPILYNVEQLMKMGNIHIHVDLIAGLPYEDYMLFGRSFNKIYRLGADMLQLGFLKVLPGTPLAEQAEDFGIVSRDRAPYEVILTSWLSAEELVRLHMIEHMVDLYYNRGGFSETLAFLISEQEENAFGLYEKLADFYYSLGFQNRSRKKEDQYRILRRFILESPDLHLKPDAEEKALRLVSEDLERWFNEDEQKRFYKKGWEVIA